MTAPHAQIHPEAACTGKVRFDCFTQANQANRRSSKGRSSIKRQVYSCSVCHGWHLGGSKPKPIRGTRK